MRPLRYASVCSGVGTCAMAWRPLGWDTAWFCELADFPSAVLAHRYPEVVNHGDMLAVLESLKRRLRGEETDLYVDVDIDVIAGGTPCQAFSTAGDRLSLGDPRGNLTLAFCQLVHTLNALRPDGLPVVVWENVPGVLTTPDNAFGCFLAGLAGDDEPVLPPSGVLPKRWRTDKKSGRPVFSWPDAGVVVGPSRSVAWRVSDAQYHGLAQRRRRVVVVSCARASGLDPGAILFEPGGVRRHPPARPPAGSQDAGGPPGRAGARGRAAGPADDSDVARTLNAQGGTGRHDVSTETLIPVIAGPLLAGSGDQGRRIDAEGAASGHLIVEDAAVGPLLASGGRQGLAQVDAAAAGHLVVAEALPIAELGKRRGFDKPGNRNGTGIGEHGDPCFTLGTDSRHGVLEPARDGLDMRNLSVTGDDATMPVMAGSKGTSPGTLPHVMEPIPFDTTQITSAYNYSNPRPGDPCHPVVAHGHPPAIAFSCKDHGADATEELSPTLRAMGHDGSHQNGGGQMAVCEAYRTNPGGEVMAQGDRVAALTTSTDRCSTIVRQFAGAMRRVRRLTPRECERLQGYDDDHTLVPFRGKPAADGPRYKAIGNGWAMPVFRWVGERIAAAAGA